MDGRGIRSLGAAALAMAAIGLTAPAAFGATGVSVSSVSSLKAGAKAGTLTGKVINDTDRAERAEVDGADLPPRHEGAGHRPHRGQRRGATAPRLTAST